MTKEEIIIATNKEFTLLASICTKMDDAIYFASLNEKWSVADNVKHLLISTNMSSLAFWLPMFLVRWIGGTPNRPSKSYDELVAKYKLKLEQGAVASGRFVPKPTKDVTTKKSILKQWDKVSTHYLSALKKNRTEEDLDNYLVKHPLLGKLTIRELCYFTIYHTQHHLQAINNIISK
jgi:DinB superfamily